METTVKTNKFQYEVILQQNNGFGWDDVEFFETKSNYLLNKDDKEELKRLRIEYRIAQPFAALRTIHRKAKINTKSPINNSNNSNLDYWERKQKVFEQSQMDSCSMIEFDTHESY